MPFGKLKAMLDQRRQREDLYSTAAYWNSKAQHLEGHAVSMWPNNYLNGHYHREQMTYLAHYWNNARGKYMLDLGCGTGRLSRAFAESGARVLGIDFAAAAIDVARKLSEGDNPSYKVQSVFDLEENACFDLVFVWGVLTVACKNRQELLRAVTRIHRSIKPGGKLLLMEPIHRGFLHRVLDMNIGEFLEVMRQAGFKIEDVTHLHFWPARLALAYFRWPKLITTPGYYIGQWIMRLFGNKAFGDYKAVRASV
jgi:2-polyprenyl-3-methyl-5-hydroxy-6-metoxy-1,4-benzoquinol methylase